MLSKFLRRARHRFLDNRHRDRVFRPRLEPLESRSLLAAITVTTAADDITPNDGTVSLREAITAIDAGNNLGDPNIIAQNPGTFGVNDTINFNIPGGPSNTILIGTDPSALGLALPTITKAVTINGSGPDVTLLDGDHEHRVFLISGSFTVNISGVTIQDGRDASGGGGIEVDVASLNLTNCIVRQNTSPNGDGGGIFNSGGTLTLTGVTVMDNTAPLGDGGGIYNGGVATLIVTDSTIDHNSVSGPESSGDGGGIYNSDGNVTLTRTTVSNNTALSNGDGGGIFDNGNLTIINSTITNNMAGEGGGIYFSSGTLQLTSDTIVFNYLKTATIPPPPARSSRRTRAATVAATALRIRPTTISTAMEHALPPTVASAISRPTRCLAR